MQPWLSRFFSGLFDRLVLAVAHLQADQADDLCRLFLMRWCIS